MSCNLSSLGIGILSAPFVYSNREPSGLQVPLMRPNLPAPWRPEEPIRDHRYRSDHLKWHCKSIIIGISPHLSIVVVHHYSLDSWDISSIDQDLFA